MAARRTWTRERFPPYAESAGHRVRPHQCLRACRGEANGPCPPIPDDADGGNPESRGELIGVDMKRSRMVGLAAGPALVVTGLEEPADSRWR